MYKQNKLCPFCYFCATISSIFLSVASSSLNRFNPGASSSTTHSPGPISQAHACLPLLWATVICLQLVAALRPTHAYCSSLLPPSTTAGFTWSSSSRTVKLWRLSQLYKLRLQHGASVSPRAFTASSCVVALRVHQTISKIITTRHTEGNFHGALPSSHAVPRRVSWKSTSIKQPLHGDCSVLCFD